MAPPLDTPPNVLVDWDATLGIDPSQLTLSAKISLIYSLVQYLGLTLLTFFTGLFESQTKPLWTDVKRFYGCRVQDGVLYEFAPLSIWNIWVQYSTTLAQHLADHIIKPTAFHLGREEIYRTVRDPTLKVNLSKITLKEVCENLDPTYLQDKYVTSMPLIFSLLVHLMETPNRYRLTQASAGHGIVSEAQDDSSSEESGSEDESESPSRSTAILNPMSRSPATLSISGLRRTRSDLAMNQVTSKLPKKRFLVATVVISAILYTCNRANNALQSALGIVLSIEGTSQCIIKSFRAMGMSISPTAIDEIRIRLSKEAIERAKSLINSPRPWIFVFDNINIYLREFAQRIGNLNTMLNLTNTAVVELPPGIPDSAFDIDDFKAHLWMQDAMGAMVAQILIDHCPGRTKWPGRRTLKDAIKMVMPKDRPLEPRKTVAYPFGAMDINKGSKKGVIKVIVELARRACTTGSELARSVRIIAGDFLTVRNLQSCKADRVDDISDFHRLSFVVELSQLFHYSLNAYITLIKVYLGADNAMLNASSLSRHKDHLRRSFDVNKAPYAETSDLVQTSLYARIVDCVMQIKQFRELSRLETWRPEKEELINILKEVVAKFACPRTTEMELHENGSVAGGHVLAHSVLFIRDALILQVFDHAVRCGDPGIVLQVLKFWMFSFRGAGQINYMRECLEVLLTLTHEVSPEL